MQKKITIAFVFFILFIWDIFAQNKPILYEFGELPQTLMLNPGSETNYRFHIGVPFVSGISFSIASSRVKLEDLFLKDNINFNVKFAKVLNILNENDDLSFNTQVEVFSGGYRYDDKTYLSFGFYEEIDFIGYFPKDIATLIYEGNASYLNKIFSLSQLVFKMDASGVLHIGVSRKLNKKVTVGARLKMYSSSINISTNNNLGTITTVLGNKNIYKHYFNNLNVNIQTSGIVSDNNDVDRKSLISDTFFGRNLGLGLDLGFTYKVNNHLKFTGSIIDLGFINHKKNNFSYTIKGNYTFEGVNFKYNLLNTRNYWQELNDDFKKKIDAKSNTDSYISWRPTKINISLKHSFGKIRLNKKCYDKSYKEYYNNSIGMQLYTIFRPLHPQIAFTGFYERVISEKIFTKFTYTIDRYSLTNLGAGFSIQIGKVNLYGMIDNLFKLKDLNTANNVSLQIGFNVIFN